MLESFLPDLNLKSYKIEGSKLRNLKSKEFKEGKS